MILCGPLWNSFLFRKVARRSTELHGVKRIDNLLCGPLWNSFSVPQIFTDWPGVRLLIILFEDFCEFFGWRSEHKKSLSIVNRMVLNFAYKKGWFIGFNVILRRLIDKFGMPEKTIKKLLLLCNRPGAIASV